MGEKMTETNVDIVYCIDATSSMTPCIETVKQNAKTLHTDIINATSAGGYTVQQLRLKVILFRDFSFDEENAIKESRFFNLPDETDEYEAFINEIEVIGGGPLPESSLEALHLAINSDWVAPADGVRTRHVIVMFTDAPAHMLDDQEYREIADENPLYPKETPRDLTGLIEEWQIKMNERERRLVIFAPDAEPWTEVEYNFLPCLMMFADVGEGLDEITEDAILDLVCDSICHYC